MWRCSVMAALALATGCGTRHEPPHATTSQSLPVQRSPSETRCTLRVSTKGILVDGDRKSRAEAVATCKRTAGAIVIIDDNAPADEWKALQTALGREGVPLLMRGPVNDNDCLNNPLAKGCN
jgi:hypothetical protein